MSYSGAMKKLYSHLPLLLSLLLTVPPVHASDKKVPEWMMSPYGSEEAYKSAKSKELDSLSEQALFEKNHASKPGPLKDFNGRQRQVRVLTVDTRDQTSCKKIENNISNQLSLDSGELKDLCKKKLEKPYSSIVIVDSREKMVQLSPQKAKLIDDTGNLVLFSFGLVAAMTFLPESVSNWDEEQRDLGNFGEKYKNHVSKPPVMDKDKGVINWVGHPYAGAAYYVLARHSGLSRLQSFGYSAFLSTFMWEYGAEAFFEEPSIQDLWITPVLGSLLGEGFLMLEEKIIDNDRRVFGSKSLGSLALGLLDPAGALSDGMNNLFGFKAIDHSELHLVQMPSYNHRGDYVTSALGVELKFIFK